MVTPVGAKALTLVLCVALQSIPGSTALGKYQDEDVQFADL